jgi:hypothetical protein
MAGDLLLPHDRQMPRPPYHPQTWFSSLVIEGICGQCLLMLLDTWIAGSGWRAGNAHDRHCNHVPGSENPPSLKQYDMIGSLRCVS